MTGAAPTFGEIFTFEHLWECAKDCCKGVRWKASTQNFEADMLLWVANLHAGLMAGTWRSRGFHQFTIVERGKVRNIQSVHISERTVQKCLVRYGLRPLIMPKLIKDTYATLPGKGTDSAIARHAEHARMFYREYGRDGLVQVMDYHSYFESIDHYMLYAFYDRLGLDGRTSEWARSVRA